MMTRFAETDEILARGLGDFVRHCLGPVEVARGFVNLVPQPTGEDYVLITPMTARATATPSHAFDAAAGRERITRPTQRTVQIDCYGGKAEVWAKTLSILLRDSRGCDFLEAYGFAPLYAADALNLSSGDDRGGYARRYMLEVTLHMPEQVELEQDFFTGVALESRPVS